MKQTYDTDTVSGLGLPEAVTLYVFPGDFERRGLARNVAGTAYDALAGAETQYVVGGARLTYRHRARGESPGTDPDDIDRDQRLTIGLTDIIQSTSATLDLLTGELVEVSNYYPNGARESYRGSSNGERVAPEPMGFTGKEADEEVGLVYFGQRYLLAHLGRWASPDPLQVHAVGGGEALNGYHYVSGNVLQARDPLGLDPSHSIREEINRAAETSSVARAIVRSFGVHSVSHVLNEVAPESHGLDPRHTASFGSDAYLARATDAGGTGFRAELEDGAIGEQGNHFLQAVSLGVLVAESERRAASSSAGAYGGLRGLAVAAMVGWEVNSTGSMPERALSGATSPAMMAAFHSAVQYVHDAAAVGADIDYDELDRILGPALEASPEVPVGGASRADLRLGVVGFAAGEMLSDVERGSADAAFHSRGDAAAWLERQVVGSDTPSSPTALPEEAPSESSP